MNASPKTLSRRQFLGGPALGAVSMMMRSVADGEKEQEPADSRGKALIAITLDLEMARNFPRWEDTGWDYEKGNLDEKTKRYAVEAGRWVKAAGGVIHYFLVGRALEQESVAWLEEVIRAGHSVGNHTYDHVNVLANTPEEIQFRFRRAPWLIAGKAPAEVIRENIRLTSAAMSERLKISAAGFRTPGGFADGLAGRADVQQMLLDLGFTWVSSKYPLHPNSEPGTDPDDLVFAGIVHAQQAAQPFVYPSGLVEIPMSPISDVGAFRNGRWKLDHFLKAIRMCVEWAISQRAVFDFLGHPAVLSAMDPEFRSLKLIGELVKQAGDRAVIVTLDTIAHRIKSKTESR
jgi:peptidoglycan/xylan/chitin deacetylase (PgdA/CDA1 family)